MRGTGAPEQWVPLRSYSTGLEAEMAQQSLREAGIPSLLQSSRAGVFGLTFQGSVPGGITIAVPGSAVDRARELLEEDTMDSIHGDANEIRELARYEVRPEALEECLAAIHEFVAYVRANEAGALRYEVWQETEQPTRFVHLFVWKDAEANRIHGKSEAVRKFAGILYPNCLAPVEFIEYRQVDANAAFRRV